MVDRERLTSHIKSPEMMIKIRKLIDKAEIAVDKHLVLDSDYLDPFERQTAKAIFRSIPGLGFIEAGGHENSERKFFLMFPDYMSQNDFNGKSSYLEIAGDIDSLDHRDFLGSLIGMGIKREKLGDIYILEGSAVVCTKNEIADYLLMNLEKVGKIKVKCSILQTDQIVIPEQEYDLKNLFVASERLDAILGAAYRLSRSESKLKIESGDVKVNWAQILKSSHELVPGDIISVRGLGRAIYHDRLGISKKGRLNIALKIYK